MKKRASKASRKRFVLPVIVGLVSGMIVVTIVGFITAQFFTNPRVVTANTLSNHQLRFVSLSDGTTPMTEVPSVLPQGGVTINNQFVLRPLSTVQRATVNIAASQATKIGRQYADAHPFPATTLLASITSINSVPPPGVVASNAHVIQNVLAWIVTFTSTSPQDVVQGKKGSPTNFPTHFNIVINANTGAFVLGFFTE